jgi:prepilin-type N-terminal cleavage/methylation domain-containing protein
MRQRSEGGFTLIEMMVVVGLIAILAAVVIPQWMRQTRKTKGDSEINAMFVEIATKEEQYKIDNSAYLATTSCPASPTTVGVNFQTSCVTTGSAWATLRVNPSESVLRCTYGVTAGVAGATLTPPAGFTVANQPAGAWYYILAICDLDGQGGTNTQYFQTSLDTKMQKTNFGS